MHRTYLVQDAKNFVTRWAHFLLFLIVHTVFEEHALTDIFRYFKESNHSEISVLYLMTLSLVFFHIFLTSWGIYGYEGWDCCSIILIQYARGWEKSFNTFFPNGFLSGILCDVQRGEHCVAMIRMFCHHWTQCPYIM